MTRRSTAALSIVVALLGAACSTPATRRIGSPPPLASSSPSPSVSVSASPATPGSGGNAPAVRVGSVTRTFIDDTRTVSAQHTRTGAPGPRVLATVILFPAVGAAHGPAVPDAQPATGPFPTVVFAPGFDRAPADYMPLLTAWAHAGFVVVAITFPLTNPYAIGGLDETDIVNQPGDVHFVIAQVLRSSHFGSGPMKGLVDPARIAVAGHSDGAQTAVLVAASTCCVDRRVRALIVMAGAQLPSGSYFSSSSPPTMVMQGTADTISPPISALAVYRMARTPKYLLLLKGADHLLPFTGTNPYERVVRTTSIAFFDRYLNGARRPVTLASGEKRIAALHHVGG